MTVIKNSNARSWITTRDMALVSLFAVLVGIGAMIRIPLPFSPVPLTLQTAMVMATGMLLGSRKGAVALFMYMLMGLVGLPLFTGGGGIHNLLLPSFGFIVGFIPSAWVIGFLCETFAPRIATIKQRSCAAFAVRTMACLAGFVAYNVIGVLWLYMNINFVMGKSVTLFQTLGMGLFPFIVPDMLKLVATVIVVSIVSERIGSLDLFRDR